MLFHEISVRKPGAIEQTEVLKRTVDVGLSLGNAVLPEIILGISFLTYKNGGNDVNFSRLLCGLEIRKKKQENKKDKTHCLAHNSCSMNSACSYVCGGCCYENVEKLRACYDIFPSYLLLANVFKYRRKAALWSSLFLILKILNPLLPICQE